MTWWPGSYAEQDTEDLQEMNLWKKEAAELKSKTSKWLPLSLRLCDCYWSNSSKSGNISQVVINIVRARKTILLLYAGSPQVELQGDTRGFPFESHPTSVMYNPRQIYTCEKFKIES